VKDELSITDNSKNNLLQRYITSASAAASQYCNRRFQAETVKDQFWPDRDPYPYVIPGGVDILRLSRWPIVSVASVVENGVTLVQDTDFKIDAENGALIRLESATGYPRKWYALPIEVTFTGGFDTIPDDVEDAVIRMVTRRYSIKGRDPNLKQESVPGVIDRSWWVATGVEAGNITPDISDILDNYRVIVMA
jgi:hypothetical protein